MIYATSLVSGSLDSTVNIFDLTTLLFW